MKKIFLCVVLLSLCLLYSCKSSIERKAERQLKETLIELSKNPDTFKIENIETKYCCDSLCVLHCRTKGQNGFGGYSASNIEYLYVIHNSDNKVFECVRDLSEDKSVLNYVSPGQDLHNLTEEQWIYYYAAVLSIIEGREITK